MKRLRFAPAAITPVYFFDVLTSFFSVGQGVSKFESRLAKYFSHDNAYTFGSLMRTVYACFIGLRSSSDKSMVILPRYSCPSFIHGVIAAGLDVEYCDVDPLTLSIDLKSLSEINMDNVLAVVCTNLFGLTSEIDKVNDICKPFGVYVIEGVDYGIGTEYKGKRIGTWGDVTILNFQEGKAIPVGGGAIISSLNLFKKMYGKKRKKSFPNYVTMLGFIIFSRPIMYGLFMRTSRILKIERKNFSMEDTIRKTSDETDFKFEQNGFERSISDFQGRLACRVMDRLKKDIACRYNNAVKLFQILDAISGVHIIKEHESVNKVHFIRLPILIADEKRDEILFKLLSVGIEASPMYIEHGMGIDSSDFPGAARVANELLTLPCHPYMNDEDIKLIREVLQ